MTRDQTNAKVVRAGEAYLTIYASEMQVLAADAWIWGQKETGGDLFGLWTHGGRPVVLLVTMAGPEAVHHSAHFAQDLDFFRHLNRQLAQATPLQWIGTWHSHHGLGIDEPSGGDINQVQGVTSKNHFPYWCELIVNHDGVGHPRDARSWSGSKQAGSQPQPRVRVNAFFYANPQEDGPDRCAVRVVAGISPFRVAALWSHLVAPADIGEAGRGFPREQIELGHLDPETDKLADVPDTARNSAVPQMLAEQCAELDGELQQDIAFEVGQDSIALTVGLPETQCARVTYDGRPPHRVRLVELRRSVDGEYEVVAKSMAKGGSDCRLREICQMLLAEQLPRLRRMV